MFLPEAIPLDILFEDRHLLVVNKPAGMVTHPAYSNYTGTLVNALLHHSAELSAVYDRTRPGIVHRLDKDTSGLLVVAKTDAAHAHLRGFSLRAARSGGSIMQSSGERFPKASGTIEANLGRSKADRKKMAVVKDGKTAVTDYTVLESFAYLSLVKLRLRTGRTHQIRVHLAHVQHPVFGDPTYNGRRLLYGPGTPRQKGEVQSMLAILRARGSTHGLSGSSTRPQARR